MKQVPVISVYIDVDLLYILFCIIMIFENFFFLLLLISNNLGIKAIMNQENVTYAEAEDLYFSLLDKSSLHLAFFFLISMLIGSGIIK